jgi:hypothetical protein
MIDLSEENLTRIFKEMRGACTLIQMDLNGENEENEFIPTIHEGTLGKNLRGDFCVRIQVKTTETPKRNLFGELYMHQHEERECDVILPAQFNPFVGHMIATNRETGELFSIVMTNPMNSHAIRIFELLKHAEMLESYNVTMSTILRAQIQSDLESEVSGFIESIK